MQITGKEKRLEILVSLRCLSNNDLNLKIVLIICSQGTNRRTNYKLDGAENYP